MEILDGGHGRIAHPPVAVDGTVSSNQTTRRPKMHQQGGGFVATT